MSSGLTGGPLYMVGAGSGRDTIHLPTPTDGGDGKSRVLAAATDVLNLTGTAAARAGRVAPDHARRAFPGTCDPRIEASGHGQY